MDSDWGDKLMKKIIIIYFVLLTLFSWGQYSNVLTKGVLSQYTLKTNAVFVYELDETSGTSVTDAISNNTATSSNCTVNQTGKVNKAYSFNGTTSVITTPITSHYTEMSFSVWIYPTGSGEGSLGRIFDKTSGSATVTRIFYDYANTRIEFGCARTTNQNAWITATGSIQLDNWYHIVVTYNSSSASNNPVIYINGSSVSITKTQTGSGSVITNTNYWYIGNRGDNARTFAGLIDQPAIYSSIITPDRVLNLYKSGNGRAVADW